MIVRVLGEGQWRVDDSLRDRLNELDDEVAKAVDAGDEEALHRSLAALADAVRSAGEQLPPEDLSVSDAIVPPEDLSLDEARELLSSDGFIPDLPTPA
jgi:PspAA-like protein